jgi:hypothetical protein
VRKNRPLVSTDGFLAQVSSRIRNLAHAGADFRFSRLSYKEMDELEIWEIDIRSVVKRSSAKELLGHSVAEGPAYRIEGETTSGIKVAIRVRINVRKDQTPLLMIERVWRLERSWP